MAKYSGLHIRIEFGGRTLYSCKMMASWFGWTAVPVLAIQKSSGLPIMPTEICVKIVKQVPRAAFVAFTSGACSLWLGLRSGGESLDRLVGRCVADPFCSHLVCQACCCS